MSYSFGKKHVVYFHKNICEHLLCKNNEMRYSEQLDDMIINLEGCRVERQYAHTHTHKYTLSNYTVLTGAEQGKTIKLLLECS